MEGYLWVLQRTTHDSKDKRHTKWWVCKRQRASPKGERPHIELSLRELTLYTASGRACSSEMCGEEVHSSSSLDRDVGIMEWGPPLSAVGPKGTLCYPIRIGWPPGCGCDRPLHGTRFSCHLSTHSDL